MGKEYSWSYASGNSLYGEVTDYYIDVQAVSNAHLDIYTRLGSLNYTYVGSIHGKNSYQMSTVNVIMNVVLVLVPDISGNDATVSFTVQENLPNYPQWVIVLAAGWWLVCIWFGINFILLIIFKDTLEPEGEYNKDEDSPNRIPNMINFTPPISQSVEYEKSKPLNNCIKCYWTNWAKFREHTEIIYGVGVPVDQDISVPLAQETHRSIMIPTETDLQSNVPQRNNISYEL